MLIDDIISAVIHALNEKINMIFKDLIPLKNPIEKVFLKCKPN